jgi:hypothetical protein
MTRDTPRCLSPLPAALVALAIGACNDPPQFLPLNQAGGPAGILEGSLTYSGPPPCTEDGQVVGAAVLLAFDTRLLPPPEGLGTSAASLGVVPGAALFAGVTDQLTFNADGSRWCPSPSAGMVTTTASFSLGPLSGGEYEVRGFYDLAGAFDPAFSISKLPRKGDIAGGAIDNVSAVLMGAAPAYRRITLGTPDGMGGYAVPPGGATVDGVAVTLGLSLPEEVPIFYASGVAYSMSACVNGAVHPAAPTSNDPTHVTMPADYTLPSFSPLDLMGTEDSLVRITLSAGVPAAEAATAATPPYDLPLTNPTFAFSWQDVNGDGMLGIATDHAAASPVLPSLFPLALFTKLASPTDDLATQASPVVIVQGLTFYKSLMDTLNWPNNPPANNLVHDPSVIIGLTPAVLCIDPTDFTPSAKAKLVLTHLADCGGADPILLDRQGTLAALSKQFGREVDLVEACLPQGRYMMNLVYGSGQAWSVPNEAGACQALEPKSADGTKCVAIGTPGASRTLLPSQDVALTIGPPDDPAYCITHPVPPECCPAGGCK